jgi:hypothetical protein
MKLKFNRYFYITVACVALLLAGAGTLIGWRIHQHNQKKAAQSQLFATEVSAEVMALLQQYALGAGAARIDNDGRYATVEELLARGFLKPEFAQVMETHPSLKPCGDYVIVEIQKDEKDEPIDRRKYAGICLYSPVDKKKPLLLVLMDSNDSTDGRLYQALPGAPTEPFRRWPSAKELDENFDVMERRISNSLDDATLDI